MQLEERQFHAALCQSVRERSLFRFQCASFFLASVSFVQTANYEQFPLVSVPRVIAVRENETMKRGR